jgi:hypothetical protein
MPLSNASVTTSNMELTPCRVTYKGVDLGGTLSNVIVRPAFEKADILADQSGTTVRDRRVSGLNIQVETELTEVELKENWKVVFPHAFLVESGGNKQITFPNNVGDGDLSNAGILILHPLNKVDADLSADHKFFKATADATSEFVFSPTDQSRLKVIWNILPDDSTTPELFYVYGDPSIGIVDATAGTPSFSGTGDGTMSPVAAYNQYTVDETITAVCVTPVVNGGIFHVAGSVSGSLGLATVGTPFVAEGNEISFTINDGATDFVLNDQFDVVMTAANYV